MYDINFFAIYKKKQSKNNSLKILAIVFITLLILFNAAIIGGGIFIKSTLEKNIAEQEAYINAKDTRAKIEAANKVRKEADITTDYLAALKSAFDGFNSINLVNTALLFEIRRITPITTVINSSQINENSITLNCTCANTTDPIDMYHALLINDNFSNVTFVGYSIVPETGLSSFSVSFQVKGGIKP